MDRYHEGGFWVVQSHGGALTARAQPDKMKTVNLKSGYETVFTVTDYYGHPRKGIANYRTKPHFYKCVSKKRKNHDSGLFQLTPLDSETFKLAMEHWEIWRRWLVAFYARKTDISTGPALPREASRHAELTRILDKLLVSDPEKSITRIGQFEVLQEPSLPTNVIRQLQVKWIKPVD
jgi:hypothetical protein